MNKLVQAEITRMSEVQPEPIEWLLPGFIAYGKLSIIMGDPALGKSLVTLDLAARITKELPWPANNGFAQIGDVLLISNEDDPADTIRPRLDAAGADSSRVHLLSFIREIDGSGKRLFSVAEDVDVLMAFLSNHPACRLIIIDPISSYLFGTDGNNNIEMRSILAPLADLAQMYKVAILCVTHINKSEHRTSLNRMSGSIAFGALARFVFVVTKDQENPKRRLMLQAKNNLAEDAKGLAYSVKDTDGFPVVVWENEYVTVSADAAFSGENKQKTSEMNDAVSWLMELLSSGKMKSKEIAVLAQEEGFSVTTVRRAKKKLGVASIREEYGEEGSWWCELPKALIYSIDAQP